MVETEQIRFTMKTLRLAGMYQAFDGGENNSYFAVGRTKKIRALEKRALPGESSMQAGAGAPPMCNLTRNWASGIPPSS